MRDVEGIRVNGQFEVGRHYGNVLRGRIAEPNVGEWKDMG